VSMMADFMQLDERASQWAIGVIRCTGFKGGRTIRQKGSKKGKNIHRRRL